MKKKTRKKNRTKPKMTRRKRYSMESDHEPTNELDSIFYHDIETIIGYSQKGYGYGKTRSPKYTRTVTFLYKLQELGWREDFIASNFSYMHDELISNWPDSLLIALIFSNIIRNRVAAHHTIKESLFIIGLRNSISSKLFVILQPLEDSSYTKEQLLNIGIEFILGKYEPITPPNTSHLFYPEIVNKWTNAIINERSCSIYNIPYQCDTNNGMNQLREALQIHKRSDNTTYYFHATSWRSSKSIVRRIDHQKGRPCLDFGIRPGFYMTPSMETCIDWCRKNKNRWGNETVIVVFEIPNQLSSYLDTKYLDGTEWIQVTKEARECKSEEEIDMIYNYDLIYGNMVSNPTMVHQCKELPNHHHPPKKQLMSRTNKADRFIHQCMMGCIYFQK
jgi:hypothetical protein